MSSFTVTLPSRRLARLIRIVRVLICGVLKEDAFLKFDVVETVAVFQQPLIRVSVGRAIVGCAAPFSDPAHDEKVQCDN